MAPAHDATVPANALVLMSSFCGGGPSDLEVLVDGVPASLVVATERTAGVGFQIVPEPAPGALVEIEGCPGWESCDEAVAQTGQDPWEKIERSFTVAERDEQAPASPVVRGLDYVIEEADDSYCGSEEGPQPSRQWSFTVDGQADEQPLARADAAGNINPKAAKTKARDEVRSKPEIWQHGRERAKRILHHVRQSLSGAQQRRMRGALDDVIDAADPNRLGDVNVVLPPEIRALLDAMVQ